MRKPIRRRVRRTREQWQQLIDEQAHSGVSQSAFCRSKAISPASFQHWKRRLAETEWVKPEPLEPWLEVGRVVSPEPTGWDLELDLGHGVCLRLRQR